ncbi:MAG: tetratricopeptide repeat protein [Woeseiaceae bacterium]
MSHARTPFLILLLIGAAAMTLAPVRFASAMTAREYFSDGNRLYRDNLYWAALLRYRQAAEQGLDSAVLHYNTGVAHYRAGQHVRARQSFEKALQEPALLAATQYNLGLNAYALGDSADALQWFRRVPGSGGNAKFAALATVAIARIERAGAAASEPVTGAAAADSARPFASLELRARVGFGTNDNVFRTPGQNYIDFASEGSPLVTPQIFSGAYMPLSLSARYIVNSLPFEGFYGAYRLAGRVHSDETLNNADEYMHELSFGNEYYRKEELRAREVKSAFTIAQHDEIYYDRDFGDPRVLGGADLSDRMNYVRYGPQLSLRQSYRRVSFGAQLKGQLWNYEATDILPEYDHEYFFLQLFGQVKFTASSLLRLTAAGYSRRFGDRPSFDLDGEQRLGNPGIRYDYVSLGLRARQRIFDSLWFGVDVERTERTDQHVGYNDYSRDSFSFELHWQPTERIDFEASGIYRIYDYPNAFAFHVPAAGRKTQESADAKIVASYQLTEHLSIAAEAIYRETVSTDTRIQYERKEYLLGVRWER